MKLDNITIKNFRSIRTLSFDIKAVRNSSTFCLFGVNESGKSSFLKGIDLYHNLVPTYPDDYYDDSAYVHSDFKYTLDEKDNELLRNHLITEFDFPSDLAQKITIDEVEINVFYASQKDPTRLKIVNLLSRKNTFDDYVMNGTTVIPNLSDPDEDPGEIDVIKPKSDLRDNYEKFDFKKYYQENLKDYFWHASHEILFWESSDKYLIKDDIDLEEFAKDPFELSIPLANCFILSGIALEDIPTRIEKLTRASDISNLESLLSEEVTKHINAIWKNHPIAIKFEIDNLKISLLVEDEGVKHDVKTTSQRSDGFRQFISFLLSVSAESHSKELENCIMLIDEPETHLHPQAQVNLMSDLIKIAQANNNIVFYATHSNYMIDKSNLGRCFKVEKKENTHTLVERLVGTNSTYAEVNYTVFGIPTTDYHNELYGYLEANNPSKLHGISKDKSWFNERRGITESVSLPTYIRHSIHHPENTNNRKYTLQQLNKAIAMMRKLKYS